MRPLSPTRRRSLAEPWRATQRPSERREPVRTATSQPIRLATALALATLCQLTTSCIGASCDTHGEAVQTYRGGHTNAERTAYESSAVDEAFLFFPPGRRYRFVHGLSEAPADLHAYLSFSEFPLRSGSGFAESAGNQAMFEAVTEEHVEVRNDTCADFFIRFYAAVGPFSEADAGALGGDPPRAARLQDSSAVDAGAAAADGGAGSD